MKSIKQLIAKSPEEQLAQIAQLWGVDETPHDGWAHHLARFEEELNDSIGARFVWEHLPADERRILSHLCSIKDVSWTKLDTLQRNIQLPEARFKAAIAALQKQCLLVEERAKLQGDQLIDTRYGYYPSARQRKLPIEETTIVYIPTGISVYLHATWNEMTQPRVAYTEMGLEYLLSHLVQHDLDAVIFRQGLAISGYYGRPDAKSLAAILLEPARLLYTLMHLDDSTRSLFQWLQDQGGKVSMGAVRKRTGLPDPALAKMLRVLVQYGLAFDMFDGTERVLLIPYNIYTLLREAATHPESQVPVELVALPDPPATIYPVEMKTIYDVATLIGVIYQQNIEPTQAGTVPKRIAAKIRPLLSGSTRQRYYGEDDVYLEMLLHEMRELQLVQLSKSPLPDVKAHYEPGPALKKWAQMNMMEQTRELFNRWLTSHSWLDEPGANFEGAMSYYFQNILAREALLTYLHDCVPGRWYSFASLLRTIRSVDPYVLRPSDRLRFAGNRSKIQELMAKWDKADGEYIIGLLASSLFELGIVELGYLQAHISEKDAPVNPDAFMITEIGARVLPQVDEASHPAQEDGAFHLVSSSSNGDRTLIVQPNFEILLLQPDLPTLYRVLPFAQINKAGVVSRLTLTRTSVLRGLEAGMTVEGILQFLEEHSQKEVPQNVAYSIRDWVKYYKETKISQVFLFEVSSEAVADEIAASPKIQALQLRRIGPCVLAAPISVKLTELRKLLDAQGVLMHIQGDILTQQRDRYGTYR